MEIEREEGNKIYIKNEIVWDWEEKIRNKEGRV